MPDSSDTENRPEPVPSTASSAPTPCNFRRCADDEILMPMGAQFIRFDDVAAFTLAEGVVGRPLFGAGAMINLIEFGAGATVSAHSHPHEQLGIVLRGMQALVVDGVARELGPMEGYVLPGHVEHSAYCGPEGATVVDIFCPVREDYRERWMSSIGDPPAQ